MRGRGYIGKSVGSGGEEGRRAGAGAVASEEKAEAPGRMTSKRCVGICLAKYVSMDRKAQPRREA